MSKPTINPNVGTPLTAEAIQDWLVSNLAEQLGVEPEEIDIKERLDSYGLDSAQAMLLASKMENFLGFQLSPTLVWHYPTIDAFSERLAEESKDLDMEIVEQVSSEKLAKMLAEIEQLSPEQVNAAVTTEKQFIED
ncbi:phosphopantetheine-binding protein [Lyngbya aestuarii]|uniref:phosphopantetheine-binding protein n=1 Tax=Lyngbya aestuarii TaxID=118322 RepID=UPI00403DF4D5